MSTAATLREMIARRETEIAALREALEMMEAVDAQVGDLDGARTPETAPTAGLYGEDGRNVVSREERLSSAQRATLDAIRHLGPKARGEDIARLAGIAQASVSPTAQILKRAGFINIIGRAHGRRFELLDGTTFALGAEKQQAPAARNPDGPQRRFTDHAELEPEKVHGLAADHPAVTEGRTLFPSTVVDVRTSPRVLVSGANQRKIGDRVAKGPWKGMPIYTLTLEERATCPTTCAVWRECYGNGMPMARRHRHGPELEQQIETELRTLDLQHKATGFVVRLHILGDFYSVDYVNQWAKWLAGFPRLHVFGYTAWPGTTEIGGAIMKLRARMWQRFAVRTSVPADMILGRNPTIDCQPLATTIRRVAEGRQPEGVVCPAQTHPGVCCGSCGLCWSPEMQETPIAFVLHGPRSQAPMQPTAEPAMKRPTWTAERVSEALDKIEAAIRRRGPAVNQAQISIETGIAQTAVADFLRNLVTDGRIRIEGHARGRRYVVVETRPAPSIELPGKPEPATVPPRPAVANKPAPVPRPAVGPTVTRDTEPAKPKPAARPPVPYVPTKLDDARRAEEQALIEAFLARQGARKFEAGLLVSLLEQAFAEDDIAFEQVHSAKENKGGRTPYRVAGKLVSSDAAIKHADTIRRRMGLPPIAAEAGEVAA